MFDVSTSEYGIKVELNGFLDKDELGAFYDEMEEHVNQQPASFNIYADHRGVKAMPDGADEQFADLMAMCKEGGLDRSVVILDSAIAAMQQRRLRDEAGLEGQKIINAGSNPDWKEEAENWVEA